MNFKEAYNVWRTKYLSPAMSDDVVLMKQSTRSHVHSVRQSNNCVRPQSTASKHVRYNNCHTTTLRYVTQSLQPAPVTPVAACCCCCCWCRAAVLFQLYESFKFRFSKYVSRALAKSWQDEAGTITCSNSDNTETLNICQVFHIFNGLSLVLQEQFLLALAWVNWIKASTQRGIRAVHRSTNVSYNFRLPLLHQILLYVLVASLKSPITMHQLQ